MNNIEIITYGNECLPFSKCWCDRHPNGDTHPKCTKELLLGNAYLDVLLIVSACIFAFITIRRRNTNTNKMTTEKKFSENDFNATIGNTVLGEVYWTYNVAYLPIQVKVLEVDEEKQKARIEQGWIDFDRLYKTEKDCPQR